MKKLFLVFFFVLCFSSLVQADGFHTYTDEDKAKVDAIIITGGSEGDALIQDANGNFVPTPPAAVSVTNANVEDATTAGATVTTAADSGFIPIIISEVLSKISLTNLYLEFADGLASVFEPLKGEDDNYVTDAEKIVIEATSGTNTGDQVADGVTITGTGTVSDPFVSNATGTGDVIGPSSAVDERLARFNGITGKLIEDSGYTVDSFAAALGTDDNYVTDTEKNNLHAPSSDNQVGDGVTIIGAGTAEDPFVATGGTGDVVGPSSAVHGNIAIFSGITGKLIEDSGVDTSDFEPADATILKDADIGVNVLAPNGDGSGLSGVVTSEVDPTVPAQVSQVNAEAGTSETSYLWSPLRVFQAAAAWITANTADWDKDASDDFDGAYSSLTDPPTIPSGNQIIDWTIDQGATNIHAGNYTDTDTLTALSIGTKTATTIGITSDGGADDVVLPEADTDNAGLLGADKFDEIVANSLKVSFTWDYDYSDLINTPTIPTVDDTPYDATSWDNNTDAATKNAIRDKIESLSITGGSFLQSILPTGSDTFLASESVNSRIETYQATATAYYYFGTAATAWALHERNCEFVVENDEAIYLYPATGDQAYFNTTELSANYGIFDATPTIGSRVIVSYIYDGTDYFIQFIPIAGDWEAVAPQP